MRRARGFTLIEMILSIMILGLLATAAAMAIHHGTRAALESQTRIDTLSKLRVATERLTREIRLMRRDPATPTDFDILSRSATDLSFRRLDPNGSSVRTVTINGAAPPVVTLGYDSPAGTPVLTDQLSAFAITYWQADGTTVSADNTDLAFVEINLTLTDSHGNAFAQRSRVGLRNRQ
ncbi:MAG: prepilin-type N-terminal cleavage/methylation domain-containing protein [Gammaproteobacteria bacterium]